MTRTEKVLLVIFFILFFTVYGVLLHQHDVGMDKAMMERTRWEGVWYESDL